METPESGRIQGHLINLSSADQRLLHVSDSSPYVAQVDAGSVMAELALERLNLNTHTIVSWTDGAAGLASEMTHRLRVRRFSRLAGEILAYESEEYLRGKNERRRDNG